MKEGTGRDTKRKGAAMRFLSLLPLLLALPVQAAEVPASWKREFPKTDFSNTSIDFDEIMSGGPPRDGIPPIDDPKFVLAKDHVLPDTEPVVGVHLNGQFRAYPLRVLTWHEIVNDDIRGTPIAVTFCPLCNAAIVFDRRLDGSVLDFGTTGKLRNSDLVMYDRQTESFWQQAIGRAIVGTLTGRELTIIPARLESWKNFKSRAGGGSLVLVPNNASMRQYGQNPYANYDDAALPFLYRGDMPKHIKPLARVISTPDRRYAYSLEKIRKDQRVTANDGTDFTWTSGQNSALNSRVIAKGKDVGNVVAIRNGRDVAYFIEFAFVFHAFSPDAPIHQ